MPRSFGPPNTPTLPWVAGIVGGPAGAGGLGLALADAESGFGIAGDDTGGFSWLSTGDALVVVAFAVFVVVDLLFFDSFFAVAFLASFIISPAKKRFLVALRRKYVESLTIDSASYKLPDGGIRSDMHCQSNNYTHSIR